MDKYEDEQFFLHYTEAKWSEELDDIPPSGCGCLALVAVMVVGWALISLVVFFYCGG